MEIVIDKAASEKIRESIARRIGQNPEIYNLPADAKLRADLGKECLRCWDTTASQWVVEYLDDFEGSDVLDLVDDKVLRRAYQVGEQMPLETPILAGAVNWTLGRAGSTITYADLRDTLPDMVRDDIASAWVQLWRDAVIEVTGGDPCSTEYKFIQGEQC